MVEQLGQSMSLRVEHRHLRELFADDPARGKRLVAEAVGWYLDYSKNRITDDTIRLLLSLAEACSLRERIEAMFRGDRINSTEQRAVLHIALRAPQELFDALPQLERDAVLPPSVSARLAVEAGVAQG